MQRHKCQGGPRHACIARRLARSRARRAWRRRTAPREVRRLRRARGAWGPNPCAARRRGGAVVLPVASQAFLRCASVSGGAPVPAPRRRAPARASGRVSSVGCRHARAQQRGAAQARPCSAAPPRCAPHPSSGCGSARRTGWRSLSARMAPDRGPLGICDGARRARCAEARMPGGAPPRVHCAALDAVTRAPRWETEGRATRSAAPSSGTRGMGPTPAPRGAGGAVVLPVASQSFPLRCASVSGGASRSRSATPRARARVRSRVVCRVSPRPSAAAGCGAGAPVQRRAAPLRATPLAGGRYEHENKRLNNSGGSGGRTSRAQTAGPRRASRGPRGQRRGLEIRLRYREGQRGPLKRAKSSAGRVLVLTGGSGGRTLTGGSSGRGANA